MLNKFICVMMKFTAQLEIPLRKQTGIDSAMESIIRKLGAHG